MTRIWGVALALLSTLFLVGLFMLAQPPSAAFTDAEMTALRGITEGGLVAFEADVSISPVTRVSLLYADANLREALDPKPDDPLAPTLQEGLFQSANEGLLREYPLVTVALVGKDGSVLAKTGLDDALIEQFVALDAFKKSLDTKDEDLFSAALGGRLFAAKIARKEPGAQGRRLIAIAPVDLGGTSFLRRVLGTNPAGLVSGGKLIGEPIGGAKAEDLLKIVAEHTDVLPPDGASAAFEISSGSVRRLVSIGRVPGPAGKGPNGTIFAVLSAASSAQTERGVGDALRSAQADGAITKVSWPLVAAWLIIALALAIYLPGLEGVAPTQRLAKEFEGLAAGSQHQIFFDTYSGVHGNLARAAAKAHEAIRVAVANDTFAIDEEEVDESSLPERRRGSTRAHRALRGQGRRTKQVSAVSGDEGHASGATPDDPQAIELPAMPDEAPAIESLQGSAGSGAAPPPAAAARKPAAPAPTLHDDVVDEDEGISLANALAPSASGSRAKAPIKQPPLAPASAPLISGSSAEADELDPEMARWREVYDEFVATKQACGEPLDGFGFDKFATKLSNQTRELLSKPGVKDVHFTVYVKDGKAALKAKVVKG